MPAARSAMMNSATSVPRVGEEELLAVHLVVRDRLLAIGGEDPVDESLARLALDARMARRVDEHDAVLVEKALVALHQDLQCAAVLEREPCAAVGEDVGVHRRR